MVLIGNLNDPNAGTKSGEGTVFTSINNADQIVGAYSDSNGVVHGFLFINGRFVTEADPNAGTAAGQGTLPLSINDLGQVTGSYVGGNGVEHGFTLSNGSFVTLDDPNAGIASGQGTIPFSTNDLGQVVGYYVDNNSVAHGFLSVNGGYQTSDDPHAGTAAGKGTFSSSINAAGQIVGHYVDGSGVAHGFMETNSSFVTVDDPNAGSASGQGTVAISVNDAGLIVGYYYDSNFVAHGFLFNNGVFTTEDDPNAGTSVGQGSLPFSISNSGQIAGTYIDSAGVDHGFVISSDGVLNALSLDQQTELIYIGYFNRSADAGGFNFWEGQDAMAQTNGQSAAVALTNIANSFTPQAETIALYPFLSNPNPNYSDPTVQAGLTTFIENVYGNLFGHAADSGGLAYWAGQIESGAVGLGAAVLAIANGAQGSDEIILQNKITVALDFTTLTNQANIPTTSPLLAKAKTVLAGVDGISLNDASVTAAEALIAPWITSHPHGDLVAVVGGALPGGHPGLL